MFLAEGPVCKPNSVCPMGCRHSPSGRSSSIWDRRRRRPQAAYPRCISAGRVIPDRSREAALFGLAPRGVCLAAPVTRSAGRLLPYRFTHHLYPDRSGPSAGLFSVAHAVTAPASDAFPLGSTVPCGVRTFLPDESIEAMIQPIPSLQESRSLRVYETFLSTPCLVS